MKKVFGVMSVVMALCIPFTAAQEFVPTYFDLSGYEVIIIPSDVFRIERDLSIETEQKVKRDTLCLNVIDQTGPIPKSKVTIYAPRIHGLNLHNCKFDCVMPADVERFTLYLASATGRLSVNSVHFKCNAGAGAILQLEGTANNAVFEVGAAAQVNARGMKVKEGNVHVIGYSSLSTSIGKLWVKQVENASYTNACP